MSTMIRGTAIAPGISKNGRFYSADMIAQAVKRPSRESRQAG